MGSGGLLEQKPLQGMSMDTVRDLLYLRQVLRAGIVYQLERDFDLHTANTA